MSQNILVTTQHRGVFFAKTGEKTDLSSPTLLDLRDCRMAIKFGTTNGIQQLCKTGPTINSKIGDACDIPVLHYVTAVFAVTDEAAKIVWP